MSSKKPLASPRLQS